MTSKLKSTHPGIVKNKLRGRTGRGPGPSASHPLFTLRALSVKRIGTRRAREILFAMHVIASESAPGNVSARDGSQ